MNRLSRSGFRAIPIGRGPHPLATPPTPFKVFRLWYNTSPPRILRMIFAGDGRDVAHSDSGSIHRALSGRRDGTGNAGAIAAGGAVGSDLRGRSATAVHQATLVLATRCGHDGGRHAHARLGPRRLSRQERATGSLRRRALRQAQSLGAGDLHRLDPRHQCRCRQTDRCHARRLEGDFAGTGSLLPRRQPSGGHRTSVGRTPRHARRAVARAVAGVAGRPAEA